MNNSIVYDLSEVDQVRHILGRDDTPYKNVPIKLVPKSVLKHFLELLELESLSNKGQDPTVKQRVKFLRKEPVYWGLIPQLKQRTDDPLVNLEKKRKASRECHQRKRRKLKHEIEVERDKAFNVFKDKLVKLVKVS